MKVLVIGGTMFIGRLLVSELLKEGHDVAVLHRPSPLDIDQLDLPLLALAQKVTAG